VCQREDVDGLCGVEGKTPLCAILKKDGEKRELIVIIRNEGKRGPEQGEGGKKSTQSVFTYLRMVGWREEI